MARKFLLVLAIFGGLVAGFLHSASLPPETEKRIGAQDKALSQVQRQRVSDHRIEQVLLRMLQSHRFWTTLQATTQITWFLPEKGKTTLIEKFWLRQPFWARHMIYAPGQTRPAQVTVITPSARWMQTEAGTVVQETSPSQSRLSQELAALPEQLYRLPPMYSVDHPLRRALLSPGADYLFPAPFAQRTDTRHRFLYLGEDTWQHRSVWKIQILFALNTPEAAQWTLWVDQLTGLVVKAESGPYQGAPTEVFQVLNLKVNLELPSHLFTWEGGRP